MALFRKAAATVVKLLRTLGLNTVPLASADGRLCGIRLQWKEDDPSALRGTLIKSKVGDRDLRFFVTNELDSIQKVHRKGHFYEEEELAIIGQYFNGGVFVDVGANVGNHTLYVLLVLGAKKVIAFEPLPLALSVLEVNIAINQLGNRIVLHRMALSNNVAKVDFTSPTNNLGGSRLLERPSDSGIFTARGDDALKGENVDFIKIDTEGYEVRVVQGLSETIRINRPALFVEVEGENIPAYEAFCANMGYRTAQKFQRYTGRVNYLSVYRGD